MANSKSSGSFKEYATVDTNPDAAGYWTNVVTPRVKPDVHTPIYFSIREGHTSASVATVVLQFKCDGDVGWTDAANQGTALVIGDRVELEDRGTRVQWRAGVKQNGFTSGKVIFGFDW